MKRSFFCALWLGALGAGLPFGNAFAAPADEPSPPRLRALFLGDEGHHRPADRFEQLEPVLAARNIEVDYTKRLEDLNQAKLAGYDCLIIYANWTRIEPDEEKALLDFVSDGGGLVALHCASYCFLNSPKYIALVGGQFKSHNTGVFRERIVKPDHPIMSGLSPIESWDETYVHTKHNPDRVVLAERVEGDHVEPYTWVRTHGKGRVFYTAWGHDERTWGNKDFQKLVERGIRWASAESPSVLRPRTGLKPFAYTQSPVPLPNYLAGAKWGVQGQPIRTMQKPLSPEESMQHLAMLPGFRASLFAAEPEITKPIALAWDPRGRLWVAETVDYPNNMQPPGQGHDRIKICEDTDGDGRADKFTVFAEGLSVPTGLVLANGGVIVVHSGKTEFFKDTDGDDRADERRVLFTGWGTRDTHAGPSNLHWGFDNWIWGVVGYSGFDGTVGGEHHRFGQGIYRFKPDGSKLEFVRSSNNNTWGLGFSEEGIVFGSTANGNASMYMPIANRYYEAVGGWSAARLETIADSQAFYPITEKVRQVDWHGKYTAGAGSALYTARNFPPEYWNRVQFVAEPTGHLLGKFHLEAEGADEIAHNGRSFLASDDEWTSPVAAEVGPDGALWVIDWYNYIVQHNPTPAGFQTGRGNAYETPLRDKVHGRIYRISYGEAKPESMPRLAGASPAQLVETLKNDNMLWRLMAQRLLVERGQTDVVPALCRLVNDLSTDAIGLNPAATHALRTLQGLGAIQAPEAAVNAAVVGALKHPAAGVRRTAALVLPRTEAGRDALLEAKLLEDPSAQVRLAALLALSEMPPSEMAGAAVYAMLQAPQNATDKWIQDAATAAAARHDAGFLKAVLAKFHPTESQPSEETTTNLLPNASFERENNAAPRGWRTVTYGGRAEFSIARQGHSGDRSVQILSEQGADASWSVSLPVRPRTEYRLTGWIKTEDVRKVGGARGALMNVHELQDPQQGATRAITGNNDWTPVELNFNSGELERVTVNCLFGGWGRARGTAWFDDVSLTQSAGPALPGEVGRVVRLVTANYAQRAPVGSILSTLAALKGASLGVAVPVLDGLVSGWPQGKAPELGEPQQKVLVDLMRALPAEARDRLLALAQRWDAADLFKSFVADITGALRADLANGSLSDEERIAAATRLVGLDDRPDIARAVLEKINTLTTPELASGLIKALGQSHEAGTGEVIINGWDQFSPSVRRTAISVLLRRPDWTRELLDAVEKGRRKKTDIPPEYWTQLKASSNQEIASRAEKLSAAGGTVSADREQIVKALLPLALEHGSAAHGQEVFTANCSVCHTFNGQGGKIGPDLTGIGARGRPDVLMDILDPNRSVEANYRLWNVTTKDGETYSGRLEAETQTSVEILDTTGQKHVVQRKDIASLEGSQLSIMPNGFEALPPEDLKSLLDFLSQPQQEAARAK